MNQEKIGKFIYKLRKDKKMTQQELADKLNVTDRAVSHWENGRSLPDVSLYKKLCEELNISIEELINGEKNVSNKTIENTIIEVIKESTSLKKKFKKLLICLITIFIIIIVCTIYYNLFYKINLITDSDYLYNYAIEYLKRENLNNDTNANEKDYNNFYSYHKFGIEKKNDYKYVYMWVFSQSNYIEKEEYGSALTTGYVKSLPYKITFKDNKVIKVENPKSEKTIINFIKKEYPSKLHNKSINYNNDKNISILANEVTNKKNKYYNYLNLNTNNIKLEDLELENKIFSITKKSEECIPVMLIVNKDNTFKLYTSYKSCKPNQNCDETLEYTKYKTGTYDYSILDIVKHSADANNISISNSNLPEYQIISGKGNVFITDSDNKYLNDFIKKINVDLDKCAEPK